MKELFRPRTALSLTLLLIALAALGSGIKSGVKGVGEALFLPVILFGLTLAYALGVSKWTARRAWTVITLCGFFLIYIIAGRIHEPLIEVAAALPKFELQLLGNLLRKESFDPSPILTPLNEIADRSNRLFSTIVRGLGTASTPPLVREVLWDLPLLFLSAWAGWWTSRSNRPLIALLPSLGLHAFILYYTDNDVLSLQIAAFALIALLGSSGNWNNRRENNTNIEKTICETFSSIFTLAIFIAVGAGFMPSISTKGAAQSPAGDDSLSRALGLNRKAAVSYTVAGLPRRHLIGLDPAVSQSVVFTVKTGEIPPTDKNLITEQIPYHYWRWLTYDVYDGRGWTTSPAEGESYSANESIFSLKGDRFRIIHQQVEKANSRDNHLYWTGALVRATQPFESTWRVSPKSINSGVDPLLAADMLGSLTEKRAYSADSLIPIVSAGQLRDSSKTYPQHIRERYLSLPANVPARVTDLAHELTSDSDNPYDKARAIEAYLRSFPYSLEVAPPPAGREAADYFLFDLKSGYCDYYATAMIVLARSAGLPARLVIGYSSGEYDPLEAVYIVREANAHSWVEVYFTGFGWIEFEPAASQPQVYFPENNAESGQVSSLAETREGSSRGIAYTKEGKFNSNMEFPYLVTLPLLAVLVLVKLLHSQGYLMQPASIGRIYKFIHLHGSKIHRTSARSETPSKFGENLSNRLQINDHWIRPASSEIEFLINLYLKETYSPHPVTKAEHRQAVKVWRRLFWRLLYARLIFR